MAALRELLVSFTTAFDTGPLDKGQKKVESVTDGLKKMGAALVAALAVDKVKDFVGGLLDQADALRDQSKMLGMSIGDLQAWQHAAEQSGSSADEFNSSFMKFNRNIAEAAEGSGPAVDAFAALGVKVKDASGNLVGSSDLLEQVAAGLQGVEEPAKRTAIVMDLFGRSGAKLLPLLSEGPEGIRKMRDGFQELGGGITQEFADSADEIKDKFDNWKKATLSLKVAFVSFLLPALSAVAGFLTRATVAFRKATEGTNFLKAAFITFATLAAAKAGMLAIAFAPMLLPFLKMAAIIAIVVLAVDELITTWEGGDTIIRRLVDGWFGDGATAKAVAWFKEIGAGFDQMKHDAIENNAEFQASWESTLEDIRNDFSGTFGGFFGGILAAAVDTFFVFVNAVSGGWMQFFSVSHAILEGLFFSFEVVWEDIMHVTLITLAKISDAITSTLNLAAKIPGLGDLATDTSAPGYVSASDREKGRNQRATGDLYAKAERIDRWQRGNLTADKRTADKATFRMSGQVGVGEGVLLNQPARFAVPGAGGMGPLAPGGGSPITVHNTTNVSVPPGTPSQQARAVGREASHGANRAAASAFERRGKK